MTKRKLEIYPGQFSVPELLEPIKHNASVNELLFVTVPTFTPLSHCVIVLPDLVRATCVQVFNGIDEELVAEKAVAV